MEENKKMLEKWKWIKYLGETVSPFIDKEFKQKFDQRMREFAEELDNQAYQSLLKEGNHGIKG